MKKILILLNDTKYPLLFALGLIDKLFLTWPALLQHNTITKQSSLFIFD